MKQKTAKNIMKVHELINSGYNATTALKRVGVNWSTWNKYKDEVTVSGVEHADPVENLTADFTTTDELDQIAYTVLATNKISPQTKLLLFKELYQ